MAFFDRMSETLSNKGKDVAKKAKEIAEVTSLNGQIGTQNDNITKLYREIGTLICENKENWKELDLTEQFGRLEAAQSEIERLKGEIRRVKGVKLCSNCGNEIDKDAAFCPSCGTPAPVVVEEPEPEPVPEAVVEEPTVLKCSNCGNELAEGTIFCPNCGTKVAE